MNRESVKPMPDSAAPPASLQRAEPGGEVAEPQPHRQAGAEQDADQLADHQPGDHAEGHRRGRPRPQAVAGERYAGVGQGEDGDDDEARPRLPQLLQPLAGRHRPVDRQPRGAGELRVGRLLVGAAQPGGVGDLVAPGRRTRG
jgi:hypothetical protein